MLSPMAQCKKHVDRFSEGGSSELKDVEIFASGVHRGKPYTNADLDQIVHNFNRYRNTNQPQVKPQLAIPRLMPGAPAVLGHEEEQQILERSDLPSAGWPTKLWRDGDKLKANLGGLAQVVAKAIRLRRYSGVSAEIYDNPPEGVEGEGKVLRRIALLGADVPQVKSLADLPMPTDSHSEQFANHGPTYLRFTSVRPTPGIVGCFSCFAEVTTMDPQTLLQQLQDMGLDVTLLQDLPPDKLQAIIDGVQQMLGSQNAENDGKQLEPDPNTVKDGAGFDDAFSFDDSDLPDAMDEAQAMDYSDKARKFAARAMAMMEKYCPMAKNADAPPPGTPLPGVMAPDTAPVNPMSSPMPPAPTQHPASVTMKYTEDPNFQAAVAAVVKAALGETQKEFAGIKKQASEYEANTRRANITKFCESMVEKGQLLPAQLDPGDPKARALDRDRPPVRLRTRQQGPQVPRGRQGRQPDRVGTGHERNRDRSPASQVRRIADQEQRHRWRQRRSREGQGSALCGIQLGISDRAAEVRQDARGIRCRVRGRAEKGQGAEENAHRHAVRRPGEFRLKSNHRPEK